MEIYCMCGEKEHTNFYKDHYEVTNQGDTVKSEKNDVFFGSCKNCGIVRLVSNSVDYLTYPPTNKEYKIKTYDHDRQVALKRFKLYNIKSNSVYKILDVGSGSGAFVDVCVENGIEANGCEIAKYHYQKNDDFIYRKPLQEINFPVDHFDKVTCYDVLEHVENPLTFIEELFRITKQNGICIIEIPDFFAETGNHHWKKEHIWYFNKSILSEIVKKTGFIINDVINPIPSKLVFFLEKPLQDRIRILVPPGIGDAYWSIVKLQSFLKSRNFDSPVDVHVACNTDKIHEGHKRAFPFLDLFPFVNSTGISHNTSEYSKDLWFEAYSPKKAGRTVFGSICGCDFFISYNAHLGAGRKLEDIDPEIKCDWFPDMFVSLEQENYKKEAIKKYGKYIVYYFVFHGHYLKWLNDFPIDKIVSSIKKVTEDTGCKPVFAGAIWDKKSEVLSAIVKKLQGCVDLRGLTSMQELFGLLSGSQMVVGYPSGFTILSAALRNKTLTIWNNFYNEEFMKNSCPPEVFNKTYFIENTKQLKVKNLVARIKEIV